MHVNRSYLVASDGIFTTTDAGDLDSFAAEINSRKASLSPKELAARADVIVIGRVVEDRRKCTADGFATYCTSFAVDDILAGEVASDTLHVYWLTKWVPGPHRQALFLARSGSAYEVLGVRGEGSVEARFDMIPEWGLSVTDLRSVIVSARTGKQGDRGPSH